MEAVMAKESAIDRIKKLDEQRSKILGEAKEEAIGQARTAIIELNSLGFNYELKEGSRKASKGARQAKGGPCSICNFETAPPHNGRQHRSQGKRKHRFSSGELTELGLVKV